MCFFFFLFAWCLGRGCGSTHVFLFCDDLLNFHACAVGSCVLFIGGMLGILRLYVYLQSVGLGVTGFGLLMWDFYFVLFYCAADFVFCLGGFPFLVA